MALEAEVRRLGSLDVPVHAHSPGQRGGRSSEVDLNPVIVHEEGAGVSLIDARVRLSE
jgi:hypothetical protein